MGVLQVWGGGFVTNDYGNFYAGKPISLGKVRKKENGGDRNGWIKVRRPGIGPSSARYAMISTPSIQLQGVMAFSAPVLYGPIRSYT